MRTLQIKSANFPNKMRTNGEWMLQKTSIVCVRTKWMTPIIIYLRCFSFYCSIFKIKHNL
jgi:hypothetical protein